MDKKHTLGIFWGQNGFSLVESNKGQPIQLKYMPFDTPLEGDQAEEIPKGLKFTALIQKALGEMKLTPQFINLSLPNEDLIFRSFTIPWMQPKEVKNVVEFEATKYIPIKLNDLSYTYHSVTFVENNQRNLLILFVAIRKSIIEKYIGIFEHTGLKIDNIEPSAVSLSRILHKYGLISRNQSNAIIELSQHTGKIIIIDHEVVHFVREFPLQTADSDLSNINSKIANDILVSLNFYSRQNPKAKIDKLALVSLLEFSELAKSLSDEFKKPVNSITAAKIMKSKDTNDIGILNAFGVSIRDKKFSTKNFDLSERATRRLLDAENLSENEPNYKISTGIVSLALLLTLGSWFLSNHMISDLQKREADLISRQGVFEGTDKESIEKLKTELENKLTHYRDIRNKSDIKTFLSEVPKLLPKGTWLKNFKVSYENKTIKETQLKRTVSKMHLRLEGYAYLSQSNRQLRLVNHFVTVLKENEFFSRFDSIELVSVKQEKLAKSLVTFFHIECNEK